jgi:hypothetical protein
LEAQLRAALVPLVGDRAHQVDRRILAKVVAANLLGPAGIDDPRKFNTRQAGSAGAAQSLRLEAEGETVAAAQVFGDFLADEQAKQAMQASIEKNHAARVEGGAERQRRRKETLRRMGADTLGALETYEQATGKRLSPETPASVRVQVASRIGCHPDTLLRVLKKRAEPT